MGLLSLLTAALYYHPLATITLVGVIVTLIYVTSASSRLRGIKPSKISDRIPRER